MLTNEVALVSTEIVPTDLCVQTTTSQVDIDVDASYVVTGFKREYAIVGDAYFATVTVGDTPAWLVNLINNIIDNSLSVVLGDVTILKNSVLESLRELEVAKNQYEELINIEATIDSIIASRLATLNANLANANAQIIELETTKVTPQQAVAISINQISSELNSPTGTLYGAITDIRSTVTHLNGELDAKYAELYGITDGMGYSLSVEISRVEASIEEVAGELIEAAVEQVTVAFTSADSAVASLVTTLRADMEDEFSEVRFDIGSFVTALGAVGARYGVKLTTGGVNPAGGATFLVGGFELLNDGSLVSAGFDVDEFWVGRTSVTGKKPFRIESGVVYIDTAVIQDGTITNAKIANVIQSDNYVPGVSGWIINKATDFAEFGNIYARGNIRATSLQADTVMVGTTNLAGGAVTNVYYGSSSGYTALSGGTFVAAHSPISVTLPSGSSGASFTATVVVGNTGGYTEVMIGIFKNTTQIGGGTYTVSGGSTIPYTVTAYDASPSGTNVYSVYVYPTVGNSEYWHSSMLCIGAKR